MNDEAKSKKIVVAGRNYLQNILGNVEPVTVHGMPGFRATENGVSIYCVNTGGAWFWCRTETDFLHDPDINAFPGTATPTLRAAVSALWRINKEQDPEAVYLSIRDARTRGTGILTGVANPALLTGYIEQINKASPPRGERQIGSGVPAPGMASLPHLRVLHALGVTMNQQGRVTESNGVVTLGFPRANRLEQGTKAMQIRNAGGQWQMCYLTAAGEAAAKMGATEWSTWVPVRTGSPAFDGDRKAEQDTVAGLKQLIQRLQPRGLGDPYSQANAGARRLLPHEEEEQQEKDNARIAAAEKRLSELAPVHAARAQFYDQCTQVIEAIGPLNDQTQLTY